MMAKGYTMSTGMFLAMSDSTFRKVLKESPGVLRSVKPTIHRLQALMDFCKWTLPKTGANIGIWLDVAHKLVAIEPSYVGSHTVDGAGNAKSSVEELKWRTSESTPRNVTADPCNVHSVSTASQMASGTSTHVNNLNKDCGTTLKLLHGWVVRLSNTTAVAKILKDARDEMSRLKYPRVWKGMATRWRTWFLECSAANVNQYDLETTFYRTSQPGVIEKIREGEVVELPTNVPTNDDWELYQQYEGAFRPLDSLVVFMQNAEVVVHEELFHIWATMELLASPWFLMFENISKFDGPMQAKDLTVSTLCFIMSKKSQQISHCFILCLQVRPLNQTVTTSSFEFDYSFGEQEASENVSYDEMESHLQRPEVAIARRVAYCQLALRLGLMERANTLTGKSEQFDIMVKSHITAGLVNIDILNNHQMMGAIVNPLFQNDLAMIDAGLCTREQYDSGRIELIDRMAKLLQVNLGTNLTAPKKTNKYTKKTSAADAEDPKTLAIKELNKYMQYMELDYLPKMKPLVVLGAIDEGGQPREPIYAFGPVIEKGENLPGGRNLADYIDHKGHFAIVRYATDLKAKFPTLNKVIVGQVAPHISTEVDVESLFSQSGFLANPRRSKLGNKYYERLVFTKHRLGRIYCHEPEVMRVFMKRWKNNDWEEKEEKEASDFLASEKEIYLQYFPHNKEMFYDDDNDDELPKEDDAGGKQGKTAEKSDDSSIEMISSKSDGDNSNEESSNKSSESEGSSSENDE